MPVRVRVRLKSLKGLRQGSTVETAALLNTGYTGLSPEVILPDRLAERLGLWPSEEAASTVYETVGGPVRLYYYIREGALLSVVAEGAPTEEIVVTSSSRRWSARS